MVIEGEQECWEYIYFDKWQHKFKHRTTTVLHGLAQNSIISPDFSSSGMDIKLGSIHSFCVWSFLFAYYTSVCLPTGAYWSSGRKFTMQIWHGGLVNEQHCLWFPEVPSGGLRRTRIPGWPCKLLLLSSATARLCVKTAVNWFKNEFKRSNINQAANNHLEISNTDPAY